jgi:hypothetical protein
VSAVNQPSCLSRGNGSGSGQILQHSDYRSWLWNLELSTKHNPMTEVSQPRVIPPCDCYRTSINMEHTTLHGTCVCKDVVSKKKRCHDYRQGSTSSTFDLAEFRGSQLQRKLTTQYTTMGMTSTIHKDTRSPYT